MYVEYVDLLLLIVQLYDGCRQIGNHESDDGDHYKHYQALAWGEPYGNGGAPFPTVGTGAFPYNP